MFVHSIFLFEGVRDIGGRSAQIAIVVLDLLPSFFLCLNTLVLKLFAQHAFFVQLAHLLILLLVDLLLFLLPNKHTKKVPLGLLAHALQQFLMAGRMGLKIAVLRRGLVFFIRALLQVVLHLPQNCSNPRPAHRQLLRVDQINAI